jgi:chitinase
MSLTGVAAAVAVSASASAAGSAGSLTAVFAKTNDWGAGFEGTYTVTNGTAAAVSSWSITFTLPAGETATSAWNATFTALGNNTYRLDSPTWAGPLAAGASAAAAGIEFTNTGATGAAPSACSINNAPCDGSGGGTTPPSTPSSSVTSVPTTPSTPSSSVTSVPTTPSTPSSSQPSTTPSTPATSPSTPQAGSGGHLKIAYFDQWSIYGAGYSVKKVDTSGAAANLDVINYMAENIDPTNLTCFEANKAASTDENNPSAGDGAGDNYADYGKTFDASSSVTGVADVWNQPIAGNFNQLKELKAKYPNLKVILTIGGWTYSKYFSDVAASDASRKKFVASCIDMFLNGNLPSAGGFGGPGTGAGIFDGFDLDWEYPGGGGHLGNHATAADKQNFTLLAQEFRTELDAYGAAHGGKHYYVTAAVGSGQDKIANLETDKLGNYLDWIDVMTYDMHGGFEATGPTNFQDPLHDSPSDPSKAIAPGSEKYNVDTAIKAFTAGLPDMGIPGGFPAAKLNLGIPFYWRGWTGVPSTNNGLYQSATGPSAAFPTTQQAGTASWNELKSAGLVGGASWDATTESSYIYSGGSFYTGDTPQAITARDAYAKARGLGGVFVFSLEDDDANGTLMGAVAAGMQ